MAGTSRNTYMQWAGLDVLAQITFHIGACTLHIHINIHICTYMYIYILKRFVGATQLISHPVTPDTYMVHAGQSCWGRGRRPSGHPHLRSVADGQVVPRWSQILALPLDKGMMVWGVMMWGERVWVIGASLSEPHTSVTALRMCVCMLAYLLACLHACGHIP